MDINNNQQINTFLKGMNTDVSDALIDSSQYRYAENLRLVTNTESNSGELRPIEGTTPFEYSKGDIKAMTSIRDILIVVTKDDKIWKNDTASGGSWVCIYEPKTWSEEEVPDDDERESKNKNESFGEYLSLVTRWESPKLVKLYIADGKHPLMYVNIITGESESIEDDSAVSGVDGLLSDVEGCLEPIHAELSLASGLLKPCKVLYAYRLYKLGGASTTLSAVSNIVTLYKESNEGYASSDNITNKAVDLTIPNSPVDLLEYLQIYRITYIQIGHLPEVSLIYDDKYVSQFIDTGVDVSQSTLTELLSMIKLQIIPKIIESKNDYMFAANIKYKSNELDKDITGNFTDFRIARAYSSGDFQDLVAPNNIKDYESQALKYNLQLDSQNILLYDPIYWNRPNSNTPGGVGEYISWTYICKPVYIDIKNNKFSDSSSTLPIIDQIRSLRTGEVYRYGAVFYDKTGKKSSVYWIADIMTPYIFTSGILSYDTPYCFGYTENKTVYGMNQIGIRFEINKMPKNCVGVEIVRCQRSVSDKITITQGIVGFPYRIYTRKTWNRDDYDFKDTEMICPTGLFSINKFHTDPIRPSTTYDNPDESNNAFLSMGISDNNIIMFASPEYVYQPDDILNIIKQNKNNCFVQNFYMGKCDTEVYGGLHVRVKSYNEVSDHSFWFWYSDEYQPTYMSDGFGHEHPKTWFDRNKTINLFNGPDVENNSKLIFEDNDSKEYPVAVQEVPLLTESSDHDIFALGDIAFPEVPEWNDFFDDQNNSTWQDSAVPVGTGTSFIKWSVPAANHYTYFSEDLKNMDGKMFTNLDRFNYSHPVFYPIGSTGKCIVANIDNPMPFKYSTDGVYTPIVNIRKKAVPYGGISTIDYSSYMSYGNYIQYDEGASINSIDVYDGDCYPGVFTYNASHSWYDAGTPQGVRNTSIYHVPVESDIDLSATYGDLYTRLSSENKYYVLDKAASVSMFFTQTKDAYLYNTAYGSEPMAIEYLSSKITEIDSDEYDCRIHNSELKINGEHIDNWLNYKANNFLDVDSRFGEITNMRLFKDKLLYWQNNAIGIIGSNERVILNDIDSNLIILGTGSVLQRYDYISTIYGMKKNQYEAEIQSNTTQYWWDGHNKEILGYSGGLELVPLTKVKNLTNYINTNNEIQHPSLSYDVKFDELISSVVDNHALVYNEQVQLFTSVYTFNPVYRATINNELFITDKNSIYKWNTKPASTSVLFGLPANPLVRYTVNGLSAYVKVFDISTFGGRFYGGDEGVDNLTFTFKTPLKQESTGTGSSLITNREYDFRLDIPRNNNSSYGDRMRGKTMQCELKSSSNSTDFSLQYIITKYRMSWS